jgi:intracellular multiplication protein IcmB
MRHKITGPKAGGAPMLLVLGTTEGRCEQHLINTLGPVELWAFSTSVEDVLVRNKLYTRLGAQQARRLLAANFPGGSARSEIRRRVVVLSEKGEVDNSSVTAVIEKIVEEMVSTTKVNLAMLNAQDAEKRKAAQMAGGPPKEAPAEEASAKKASAS